MLNLAFILLIVSKIEFGASSCTFPITGTWVTSDKGTLTFTSTTIPSFPTNYFGPLSFTCDTQSGHKYMAISSSFSHFGTDFEAYICLELTQISTNKYTFYMGSDFNATVGNERIKSAATGAARSFSEVCDRTVYEDGTYSVMIKEGTISSESIDCPSYLLSTWQYSFDDGSGSNACAAGSECDVCSDSQTLQFNYTICSQPIMYSLNGGLFCFYQSVIGSTSYLHVYNSDSSTDETNNFRFTCLVISASSDRVYVSQYPQNCQAGQTPTNVSSPGASLVFNQIASGTTTIATTTTTTTENTEVSSASGLGGGGIAAIVIFMLICIAAIAALVMYILWRKYQNKLDNTKPRPDPKYANGEVRNFRRSKHDGVLPEVVVVNENKEIDDETKTPRPTGKVDNVPKLPRLQSTDDVRSSLESAGAISVRRESSIVVSIPTSRSDVDKVSETEEEESATETETEQHDKTESRIEDTILEASEEEEAEVTMNGDVKSKDVVETKKKRKRVRKKKSNVTNRVNPRSPESDRGQSMTPRHGVPLKPGSASKTKASDKIVNMLNCKDKVTFGTVPTVLMKIQSPARKRKRLSAPRPRTSAASMRSIKEEEPLDLEEKLSHLRQMQTGYLQEMRKRRQSAAALKTPLELSSKTEEEVETDYSPWRRTTSAKSRGGGDSNKPARHDGTMVTHGMTSDPVVPSPEVPTAIEERRSKTFFEPKTVELEPEEVWESIANMWNLRNQYMSDSFIKLTNENK